MFYCSVCWNEIEIIDTHLTNIKQRKKHHKKYTHAYCKWRMHQFWTQDLWTIGAFFSFNFLGFLFLILAGTIGKDLILRNVGLMVLGWTIIGTLWLFWLNYFAVYRDCDEHYYRHLRAKQTESLAKGEIIRF